ncbi:MAG: hypothetical protein Q3988_06575 [Gemella sp.]|nr:hypothetical protein [Gemella sp.]
MDLHNLFTYLNIFEILFYIFSLVMTQFIATEITKRLNIDKSKARFAWLPIYGTFVLSKLTLNSYKYAAWILITSFISVISIIGAVFISILFGVSSSPITIIIAAIISLISAILTLILTYKIYRGVSKIFCYGTVATILSLFFAPIVWLVFILSKDDKDYI